MKLKFLTAFAVLLMGVSFNFSDTGSIVDLGSPAYARTISQYEMGYSHGKTDAQWGQAFGSDALYSLGGQEWRRGYADGYNAYRRR